MKAFSTSVFLLGAVSLFGCESGPNEVSDSLRHGSEDESSEPVCERGETRRCVGAGACDGCQRCEADGQWGECDCGEEAQLPQPQTPAGMDDAGTPPPLPMLPSPSTGGAESSGGMGGATTLEGGSPMAGGSSSGGSGASLDWPEYLSEHYGTSDLEDPLGLSSNGADWFASVPYDTMWIHTPGASLVVQEPRQAKWGDGVLPCFRAEGNGGDELALEEGGTHYLTITGIGEHATGRYTKWTRIAFRVEGLREDQRLIARIDWLIWQGVVKEYNLIDPRAGDADEMFVEYNATGDATPFDTRWFDILHLFVLGPGPFDFCVTEVLVTFPS